MPLTYPSIQINTGSGYITFAGADVISATVVEEINLVSVELPISTLEFTVINKDPSFSIFNPDMYGALKEKLPIDVYEFLNDEYIYIGKFYLTTWKNKSNDKIEFAAVDIIGVLEDTEFDGVFWSEPVTLAQVMAQLFDPLGVEHEFIGDVASRTVSGWIQPSTYRYALQQICFATQTTASTARRNNLALESMSLPSKFHDYVIRKKDAKQNNVELLPITASIEIVSHNYSQDTETKVIFEKYLEVGNHKVVFDNPYFDIVIDGVGYVPAVLGSEDGSFYITTEDGNYLELGGDFTLGSNSVYFYMTEAGTVTITGKAWIDNKKAFSYNEPGTETKKNKKRYLISDATLVDITRAPEILEKLRDYYKLRYTQDLTILPSKIKAGDIVLSDSLNQERIIASMNKSVLNLSGGFLAKSTLFGVLPNYIPNLENPVRRPRTNVAICGAGATRNNKWRQYA